MLRMLWLAALASGWAIPLHAQVLSRRAGEGDTAFVLRNPPQPRYVRPEHGKPVANAKAAGKPGLAYGPVAVTWNSTPALVAFYATELTSMEKDPQRDNLADPHVLIEGRVFAAVGQGRYRPYGIGPIPLMGGKPKVVSVFIADADKDSRKEMAVLLHWEGPGQQEDGQALYGAFVYDDLAAAVGDSLVRIASGADTSWATAGETLAALKPSPDPVFLLQAGGESGSWTGNATRIDTCGPFCLRLSIGDVMQGSMIKTDTCGILAGRRLFCTEKDLTEIEEIGAKETSEIFLDIENPERGARVRGPGRTRLLTWSRRQNGRDDRECPVPAIAARGNELRLFGDVSGNSLAAHFLWKQGRIGLAPSFRKRLIAALTKPDTALGELEGLGGLRDCIDPEDWDADRSILQVLDLHAVRRMLASGGIDSALESLADISKDPADTLISRYSRRLSDSLQSWKESHRPVSLEGARKIGRLLREPFYPPLDSPSVFWRDSVLCVAQQEGKSTTGMRTWNPRSETWSKIERTRYPETGITSLFERGCNTRKYIHTPDQDCWSRKMREPSQPDCPLLDCAPLLILDDTLLGTVENGDDLARAGGSSAAGWGRYRFAEDGLLYGFTDKRVGWRIFPGTTAPVYGKKRYDSNAELNYPVVVSPDQEWVAFALRSQDGKSIDLWVGRLRYRS